ncbi:MAG: succinylglutamate desuccinylase/aspartoacylase family protein, partial [Bacteroidota bacterium]
MPPPFKTANETSLEVYRIIGHLKGNSPGPTLIFFGGIHGNEPAGVKALEHVFLALDNALDTFKGEFFGIVGNLSALAKGVRFIDEDLNRIWLPHRMGSLSASTVERSIERKEMHQLHQRIHEILETSSPPFYFIDLHTTSGETEPFIVMNDSLLNRNFTRNYPLPCILGIEEYLTGALLSYINELGYVAFGFESGQHDDTDAVTNAESFIWYTLGLTGFFPMEKTRLNAQREKLNTSHTPKRFFEIYHQHLLTADEEFKMLPGFVNFQTVPKGVQISITNGRYIITKKKRQLFMPLYQDKGYEGFYFIRSVPYFFLWLSKYLRRLKADGFLAILPGIKWATSKKDALYVNKKVARFFAKSIFHLLGYRTRKMDKAHFVL